MTKKDQWIKIWFLIYVIENFIFFLGVSQKLNMTQEMVCVEVDEVRFETGF